MTFDVIDWRKRLSVKFRCALIFRGFLSLARIACYDQRKRNCELSGVESSTKCCWRAMLVAQHRRTRAFVNAIVAKYLCIGRPATSASSRGQVGLFIHCCESNNEVTNGIKSKTEVAISWLNINKREHLISGVQKSRRVLVPRDQNLECANRISSDVAVPNLFLSAILFLDYC